MTCGIYCIENIINKKKYIGKSIRIERRFAEHKRELNKGVHKNKHLQRAWNLYGELSFSFYTIQKCEPDNKIIVDLEFYFISYYNAKEQGYNDTMGGEGLFGKKHSLNTKRKMSESAKNRNNEQNEKISRSMMGHTVSLETRAKISNSKKGVRLSDETRKRIADSHHRACGEDIVFSKLKEKDVLDILVFRFIKKIKIKEIWEMYSDICSLRTIKSIIYGENWKQVYKDFLLKNRFF